MAEETKLKVGDIVICHSEVIMTGVTGDGIRTTIGKSYKLLSFEMIDGIRHFIIRNDLDRNHSSGINTYKKWFYNLREERRNKLKKIQEKC